VEPEEEEEEDTGETEQLVGPPLVGPHGSLGPSPIGATRSAPSVLRSELNTGGNEMPISELNTGELNAGSEAIERRPEILMGGTAPSRVGNGDPTSNPNGDSTSNPNGDPASNPNGDSTCNPNGDPNGDSTKNSALVQGSFAGTGNPCIVDHALIEADLGGTSGGIEIEGTSGAGILI